MVNVFALMAVASPTLKVWSVIVPDPPPEANFTFCTTRTNLNMDHWLNGVLSNVVLSPQV